MALRGNGGIDPFFFGTGVDGDFAFNSAIDLTGIGDGAFRNVSFVKTSGGDPDFSVIWPGTRVFATRSIYIGPGVTLSADGSPGGHDLPNHLPGAGAAAGRFGGGKAGGYGGHNTSSTPQNGQAGVSDTTCIGGNGGAGGTSGGGGGGAGTGGAGGVADSYTLGYTDQDWNSLYHGAGIVNGSLHAFTGGAGGGGGGACGSSGGTNHAGAGGGGGGIILLSAPVITIDGILSVKGGNGSDSGDGTVWDGGSGGGGGGGGGAVILIYGVLVVNGSIVADGGNGAAGNSGSGTKGFGGHGGRIYHFGGTEENIFITHGSSGSDG
jgi:hypothetical protein